MLDLPVIFCHLSLQLLGRLSSAKCSVPSSSQKYLFLFCQHFFNIMQCKRCIAWTFIFHFFLLKVLIIVPAVLHKKLLIPRQSECKPVKLWTAY